MTAIEEWRVVPSIPTIEASSWGRIRKLPYQSRRGWIVSNPTYGCKAKSSKTAKHEYMNYRFRAEGTIKIHQAVCEAFHGPAPIGKPYVLHDDGDALNNTKDNVYWGTQKENLNHPIFIEYCKSRTGENSPIIKGMKNKKFIPI